MEPIHNEHLYMARLAEHCQRYEDMAIHMSSYLKSKNSDVTLNDVKLLQIAFRNVIA